MPDYNRLDFAATLEGKKHKKWQSSWVFSLYNVYGRENAYAITSGIIRMIRRKRRLCKLLCSAGFLPLRTILNSEDENQFDIIFFFL